MISFYNSGYITFRNRKIGIIFSGETAEHIMDSHIETPKTHPAKHLKIQQLSKMVKLWEKEGKKRFTGTVLDHKDGVRYKIVTDVYTTFAIIITCYKY